MSLWQEGVWQNSPGWGVKEEEVALVVELQ